MTNLVGSFPVGRLTVSMVSDGAQMAPRASWFTGIDPEEWMPVVGVDSPDALFPVNFGAFVITGDDHVTLVDCGMGKMAVGQAMDGAAGMMDRLAELGIEAGDVDRIVQTHMHGDHCGWLTGVDDDTSITFPNARVFVERAEIEYWRSAAADTNFAPEFTRARIVAVEQAGLFELLDGGHRLTPEIEILPTPGHTPGHVSVVVESEGATAMLLGDVAHHCIHLERHQWLQNYDADPPTSIATRRAVVELAIARQAIVTAPHLPILTLVRMERNGDGYRYVVDTELSSA